MAATAILDCTVQHIGSLVLELCAKFGLNVSYNP